MSIFERFTLCSVIRKQLQQDRNNRNSEDEVSSSKQITTKEPNAVITWHNKLNELEVLLNKLIELVSGEIWCESIIMNASFFEVHDCNATLKAKAVGALEDCSQGVEASS